MRDLLTPFTSHSYLLSQLVQREIKARYKQSILGYLWVLLSPLAQMAVYTFVFSIVFRFQSQSVPYALFLLSVLLPWNFLQNSVNSSTMALVDNAPLIRKVSFPREIIVYAVVAAKIIDLAVAGLVFLGLYLVFGQAFHFSMLWFLIIFVAQILLVTAVSLFFAATNLFYRDIQYLANLLLIMWLYLSPIVYSSDMVPIRYRFLLQLNPLVGIFESYRAVLFQTAIPYPALAWGVGVSIFAFLISWTLFKRMERVFADIV